MKRLILFFALLGTFVGYGQNDSVTFRVDMSNYSATTYTTVHLNGTFNNWCGACNPMSDANNDSIWEVTLPLTADTIEYKFTLDGWTGQESLNPALPCTTPATVNTNRELIFTTDTVLPVVCWEACVPCSMVPMLNQIDLPIDWEGSATNYTVTDFGGTASSLVVDPTNPANMVLKTDKTAAAQTWGGTTLSTPAGFANPIPFSMGNTIIQVDVWAPDTGMAIMLKVEDHTDPTVFVEVEVKTTMAMAWQTLTFDYTNHKPGTTPIDFTKTYDMASIFYNFGIDGATAGAKDFYCDNIRFGMGSPVATYNVTFQVDMNNFTGSFTTPEVNGDFNGWCGNCAPMTDANSDGIWELMIPITSDSIEFKFSFDNWAGQETLTMGSACTKTTGMFTNRFMYVTADTVLQAVCFGECTTCATIGVSDENWLDNLTLVPNPSKGRFMISGLYEQDVTITVMDLNGRIVHSSVARNGLETSVDLHGVSSGMYLVNIANEFGSATKKVIVE